MKKSPLVLCWMLLLIVGGMGGRVWGQQETVLLRTLKFYPLRILQGEILVGYEHALHKRLSLSVGLGIHGAGQYAQVAGEPATEGCRGVWPASGYGILAGPRFYPGKTQRSAPFYIELLFATRHTKFAPFHEYAAPPCGTEGVPHKQIAPYVQRYGLQFMLGGALRRDKPFTLDMYGGLGLRLVHTDERQQEVIASTNPFYAVEPSRNDLEPTLHLGLSLGLNFAALKIRRG